MINKNSFHLDLLQLKTHKIFINFDYVFGPQTTQEEVYVNAVENLIEKFLEGKELIHDYEVSTFIFYYYYFLTLPISI